MAGPAVTPVKCLVWDLDDTLWSGTLLEGDDVAVDGPVRAVLATLDARGILQSIASRNDHDQAWDRLTALGLADYFVLPRIGWGRKSDAVRDIADRLRFGYSAMAFVDDQPVERAEVAHHLPEVRCYDTGQAAGLADLPEFSPTRVTADAAGRRLLYRAEFARDAERARYQGPDEQFVRALDLRLRVVRAGPDDLARVEELTLRTSQMNATGVHYPETALGRLALDPAHEVLVVSLADRFGSHGSVGVLLLERHPAVWHLKLLATSCRVVQFGVGAVLLRWLAGEALRAGRHLVADYRGTDRNRMMEVAYRFGGFDSAPCPCRVQLPAATADGPDRLHLVPSAQCRAEAMRVDAPDLVVAPGAVTR